jgi:glycosyltransferase involved in cell wall biosynthesis
VSVAVVIPCYRVRDHVEAVVVEASRHADAVYVIDDCCPDGTAEFLRGRGVPHNVQLLTNETNRGVGGATIAGYRAALADGHDIVVKVDGDGQIDPELIPYLIEPIVEGRADYAKGNRFFNIQDVKGMPTARLIGNAGLSFLTKLASGYWNIFDPTNGFTAIHARVLERIALHRIDERYFFESDMLFRLGTIRAHVVDVPMSAVYGGEQSGINIGRSVLPFLFRNLRNLAKRIFYTYFLRDFSVASLNLLLIAVLVPAGLIIGVFFWWRSWTTGVAATSGEVMLAALPLIVAIQLLLACFAYDVESTPRTPLHPMLRPFNRKSQPSRLAQHAASSARKV